MTAVFQLDVVTPDRTILREEVESLVVPSWNGYLGILAHHAPLLCMLRPGELHARKGGKTRRYVISGGYLEVARNRAIVLADAVQEPGKIDPEAAERDLREATRPERRLKDPEAAEWAQEWARARLKAAGRTPGRSSSP